MNYGNSECCSNNKNSNHKVNGISSSTTKRDFDKETVYAIFSVILVVVGTIIKHCVFKILN